MPGNHNPRIHGLRGAAAAAVCGYHIHRALVVDHYTIAAQPGSIAYFTLELGQFGVDLFFLISGFLITASLARHGQVGHFLANRAIRIYPAFLLPHILVFCIGPLVGYSWLAQLRPAEYALHFCSNLLFLPGVFPLPIAQIVAWSLSYEWAFYLFAATVFAACQLRSPTLRLLALSVTTALALIALTQHPRGWFFVAGAALAYWQPGKHRSPRNSPVVGSLITVCALAGFLTGFSVSLWLAVPCGGLAFQMLSRHHNPAARLLTSRPLQYLGTISYSFYLWHSMVLFGTKRALRIPLFENLSDLERAGLLTLSTLVLSLLTAHLSYTWIETRLTRRWLRQHAESSRSEHLPQAPPTSVPSIQAMSPRARISAA